MRHRLSLSDWRQGYAASVLASPWIIWGELRHVFGRLARLLRPAER